MAHSPESVTKYVCENCQVVHAGIPSTEQVGDHTFEPPTECSACGASSFIEPADWVHYYD